MNESKKKILFIDDDALVAKTIKRLLIASGYDVVLASNAVDAVEAVAIDDFDLVISDIRMPGENGVIAVEKIQNIYKKREHSCAYIFVSGYAEEDTPEHAIRLGVDRFIFKPFDTSVFIECVKEQLNLILETRKLKDERHATYPTASRADREPEKRRRVVITGIGIIAPNGTGKEAYWTGLKEGRNCVDRITFFDVSNYPTQMGAEIKDFQPEIFLKDHHEIKRMARSSQLAVGAALLAVRESKIDESDIDSASVLIGSSTSGVEYLVPEAYAFNSGGLNKVSPYVGIAGFVGSVSSEVSRAIGAKGFSHTISTGCTSSTDAMGYALRCIRHGYSDVIIAGGADACINDGILAAFCRMGATSRRKTDFHRASRPFNKDRDGFVISEGSWIFVFEELEHAKQRKAKIYGEIVGYGATCDAWHMSKPYPSGEPAVRAIQMAVNDGRLAANQIDIFEAYGNSTIINDSYETNVVKKVFGSHAHKLVMPSVKSMLGHPIGAAGAAQAAAALLALNEGFIHPTINYETPDPECDLDYVPNDGRSGNFKAALCNSLAFGGKNAALILQKFEP